MFGKNKILKAENNLGENLDVVEIFPTLQGEGVYIGYPAVFIRLGGCNLACSFCDTEFEKYENLSLQEILDEVLKLAKNKSGKIIKKLVVITGGEPMRQNISRLCEELIKLDFLVQIETNGTLFRELPLDVKIICSPKVSGGKYHKIRADLLPRINAFKFIVRSPKSSFCYPESGEESKEVGFGSLTPEILRCAQDDRIIAQDDRIIARDDKVIARGDKVIVQDDKAMVHQDKIIAQDKVIVRDGKIVGVKDDDELYLGVAEVGQSQFKIPIYVQPMDEYDEVKNKKNLEYAKELCLKNGYLLSLQMHKILGIR